MSPRAPRMCKCSNVRNRMMSCGTYHAWEIVKGLGWGEEKEMLARDKDRRSQKFKYLPGSNLKKK